MPVRPPVEKQVIRRHPDIKVLRRESDIKQLQQLQSDILDALWQKLKPSGMSKKVEGVIYIF